MPPKTYQLPYKSLAHLAGAVYGFLTNPALTNPEVSVYTQKNSTSPAYLFLRDGRGERKLPDRKTWQKLMKKKDVQGLACVASTDPADRRRVTLSYIADTSGQYELKLTFPMSALGLTPQEEQLLGAFMNSANSDSGKA